MSEKERTEGAKGILDNTEENPCGFASFFISDQDGHGKKTKGSNVKEVPWHVVSSEGDDIVMQAELPANPIFYLQVSNEEGSYFWSQWWLGDSKQSKTNAICDSIPKDCSLIHKALDGDKVEFTCEGQVPFLKDSMSRLVTLTFTKEQQSVTKVTKAVLKMPKASWAEWKQYRLRLSQANEVWGGKDEDDKDDNDKDMEDKKRKNRLNPSRRAKRAGGC